MELFIILVFILGFFVSILSAVAGIGGGALYTPILHFIVGLQLENALAVASSGILVGSLIASIIYLKRGVPVIEIAIPILAGQLISSSISTYLTIIVSKSIIYIVLSTVLIWNFIKIIRSNRIGVSEVYREYRMFEFLLLGLFVGFIAPLAGIGGGVIIVPSLIGIYGIDGKVASATSLLVIAGSYTLVTSIHIILGNMVYGYSLPLIIGILIGSILGTKIHKISKPIYIQYLVGVIALIFGLYTIYKLIESLITV